MLFSKLAKTLLDSRFDQAEMAQIAEESLPMLRDIERDGVPFTGRTGFI